MSKWLNKRLLSSTWLKYSTWWFIQPSHRLVMIQSCSLKSHPVSHCVLSDRPAPIPFYTVTFSHQKFRVYWAFQSGEGSSSIWWKSISHFHRASSLGDSTLFPCFILHLISFQHRRAVLGRGMEREAEGKQNSGGCLAPLSSSVKGSRGKDSSVGFLKIIIRFRK